MDTKTRNVCNIEKHIINLYRTKSECRDCNPIKGLKRYYQNKAKISNQQKIYYSKNRDKNYYRNRTIDVYNLEAESNFKLN